MLINAFYKFKEIGTKNRTCYYFDNITKIEDLYLHKILMDEKSYENILACNIFCKSLIDLARLSIRFDKIDEKYDSIYDRIRYLLSAKSAIIYF